ncbi:MAG: hypothetical protein EA350_02560 [Gemmatimonadales bacterium]|nr:MAG: hypothetical protein EA350_02560 [Gemmatimonadales bacterium]
MTMKTPCPTASLPLLLLTALSASLLAACGTQDTARESTGDAGAVATAEARNPVHVDSIFPIEEELRRFRIGMEPVSAFTGGETSREALVNALLRRLEAADTTGVAELAMTRTEFAYLYYPHTMYTHPPYELSPALVWFQQQNRSSRGLSRLLQAYAGKTLHDTGFRCPDEGEPLGDGRIWHGCTVLGVVPTGESVEERLFGSILELDGRFKLVSFSNEL